MSGKDNLICVVDYHKGNLQSVARGLEAAGGRVIVSDAASDVLASRAVVLPGVGAFADAMQSLTDLRLDAVIKQKIADGAPFLGICLGMQLLFEGGSEHAPAGHATPGLEILSGIVDSIPPTDATGKKYKIPHVGWNSIEFINSPSPLFEGIPEGEFFYFTHSFMAPAGPATVAQTYHSVPVVAAVARDNVYGVQFHPEKSSAAGAALLKNFVRLASGVVK